MYCVVRQLRHKTEGIIFNSFHDVPVLPDVRPYYGGGQRYDLRRSAQQPSEQCLQANSCSEPSADFVSCETRVGHKTGRRRMGSLGDTAGASEALRRCVL